jgi:valyl-tRNA synthetase
MPGSRNFATKLWNAARFTLAQIDGREPARSLEGARRACPTAGSSRACPTAAGCQPLPAGFRFDEAAQAIYAFLWHELCDGYLEMVKPLLSGPPRPMAA